MIVAETEAVPSMCNALLPFNALHIIRKAQLNVLMGNVALEMIWTSIIRIKLPHILTLTTMGAKADM